MINFIAELEKETKMQQEGGHNREWDVLMISSDNKSPTPEKVTLVGIIEIKLSPIFNRELIATLTNLDRTLRELRVCVLAKKENKCKKMRQLYHQNRRDHHFKNYLTISLHSFSNRITEGRG